ncbi:decarboxylating 6-phosphogluconate dehydrogenase [Ectothiorhodospiraceae bacterium BW-2]|nr:decarboxylating 6-phosphogluconate dehydrogenase [Ectothiorhodospiraceae bacterium BW-2]
MKLAMIGLGRMGGNMALRLARAGHEVLAYARSRETAEALAAEEANISICDNFQQLVNDFPSPRVVWLMIPYEAVDETIEQLIDAGLDRGDVIIDGGNSNYKASQRRAERLQRLDIHFIDAGTSGGVWGLENGYSMMCGGTKEAFALIEPVVKSLAPAEDKGWGHVGPAGAGHYTKMIHNGIEYGMMQALAEGLELLDAKQEFELDLLQIAKLWQHGSVVRSWLLDLTADALQRDPHLEQISDWVADSGEGRWTVQESIDAAVPAPVLSLALMMRFRSRQESSLAGRALAAMRAGFGGHATKPAEPESHRS